MPRLVHKVLPVPAAKPQTTPVNKMEMISNEPVSAISNEPIDAPVIDDMTVENEEKKIFEIITKQNIGFDKQPDEPEEPEEPEDVLYQEINTIELSCPIYAYEECVLTIKPTQEKPIKFINAAYPVLYEPNFNVVHSIMDFEEGALSFRMCIKNKGSENLNIKIHYDVQFI